MATPVRSNSRLSLAMERTDQWIFSQDIPTDVVVVVCEARFSLHVFMLVAKSNYFRKLILESKEPVLTKIDLSGIPGGPQIFEKAAKFCYGVNFEITVHNVAALRCAAEYLQMTDLYCDNNLAGRTEDFLAQVALSSLSGAIVVLKSCEDLLPLAEDVKIVQRCVDVISLKACNEANFPSRTPPNWWTEELSILDIEFFGIILSRMKKRGSNALTLASALITYTERNLRDLVRDHSGKCTKSSDSDDPGLYARERELLQSIVSHLPLEKAAFPINFLCCLLRTAIFVRASNSCKNELEKRISVMLEHVTVDDLLVMSFTYDGERLFDLDSESYPVAMHKVAKTVDSYLGEIATYPELTISKFNGIAILVPKGARKFDDDLYRAIDIFLKAHPNLDEIEREKVCSVMDPLKLTYEARLHASQNKRLPVQIVLHALYYDQLKLRSGADDQPAAAAATRSQLQSDVSLVRENEALRSELMKMKLYVSDMQKNQGSSTKGASTTSGSRKHSFFSSMSKKLGKLNPFKHGSKDSFHIDDNIGVDVTKPRRRRFSIS
ncbi:hypothetical protein OIU77_005011 [Salix suchowensis]|uniref:Root phototropism protein 2 n=1 Tax=Salix suchowensis TaxID=1278906 RepID=A0ABQ9AW94_9ROSI|nr:hypothetical protein OIU77_005011 [Salix suchowensis]